MNASGVGVADDLSVTPTDWRGENVIGRARERPASIAVGSSHRASTRAESDIHRTSAASSFSWRFNASSRITANPSGSYRTTNYRLVEPSAVFTATVGSVRSGVVAGSATIKNSNNSLIVNHKAKVQSALDGILSMHVGLIVAICCAGAAGLLGLACVAYKCHTREEGAYSLDVAENCVYEACAGGSVANGRVPGAGRGVAKKKARAGFSGSGRTSKKLAKEWYV